jgi:hypothetical protein
MTKFRSPIRIALLACVFGVVPFAHLQTTPVKRLSNGVLGERVENPSGHSNW